MVYSVQEAAVLVEVSGYYMLPVDTYFGDCLIVVFDGFILTSTSTIFRGFLSWKRCCLFGIAWSSAFQLRR